MGPGDVSSKHGTSTTIGILDGVGNDGFSGIVFDDLFDVCVCAYLAVKIRTESINVDNLFLGNLRTTFHSSLQKGAIVDATGDTREELIEIHTLRLRNSLSLRLACLQKIGATNNIIKTLVSQVCKHFSDFLSNKLEEVHNVFRSSREFLTKFFLLACYSHGARIEMANSGHNTSLCDHGNGSKTKLLCSEESSHHNIAASSDTTINTENDTITKVVAVQR
mmetsp:Transcript_59821/g.146908  ORF Transcript_59821/g.146908 Transcript_59821/m.146908 type:complete len:221 (-) Transcript_59821:4462-5124(-)